MIRFNRVAWLAVFYWWGGLNRHLLHSTLAYLVFLLVVYAVSYTTGLVLQTSVENIRLLGSFVVFLLVFRLNQCFTRQHEGKEGTVQLFTQCENIISLCCTNLRGSNENALSKEEDFGFGDEVEAAVKIRGYTELAVATKINCVRLTLALAISVALHWRFIEAESTASGELSERSLNVVMFLYCRLQELLYPEEMALVDEAIWVSREEISRAQGIHGRLRRAAVRASAGCNQPEAKRYLYRANANIFRLRHLCMGDREDRELLLGHVKKRSNRDPEDPESMSEIEGVAIASLPKIISNMLLDALGQPLNQPWGYPERIMNNTLRTVQGLMWDFGKLNNLIEMPLPLSYYQHCRIMLLIYAVCIPLTVDPSSGLVDNVIMPFLIFWALMGFEVLAELIENPLSDEETDIDIMQMIHSIEVHASHTFELTERRRAQVRHALRRPLKDFGMIAGKELLAPEVNLNAPKSSFLSFFHWKAMPTLLIESSLVHHGHADALHEAHFLTRMTGSLRPLLRQSLRRMHRGDAYHRLGQNAPEDEAKEQFSVEDFGVISHYLVFAGTQFSRDPTSGGGDHTPGSSAASTDARSFAHEQNKQFQERAANLLRRNSAASLFAVTGPEDSARSIVGPDASDRDPRASLSCGGEGVLM